MIEVASGIEIDKSGTAFQSHQQGFELETRKHRHRDIMIEDKHLQDAGRGLRLLGLHLRTDVLAENRLGWATGH